MARYVWMGKYSARDALQLRRRVSRVGSRLSIS
jgi:hypothetical protein